MELAHIETKLQAVLPFGPGQVLIDLEVTGKLRIGPGVNNGVDATPGFEDKIGESAWQGKVPVGQDLTPIVA